MPEKKVFFFMAALISVLSLTLIASAQNLSAQESPSRLKEITGSIDAWRGKTVQMRLKLKYRDTIFGKLVFYDSDNSDIEFDISSNSEKERLAPEIANLHEGMEYIVVFKVKEVGALGAILAELETFQPVILKQLP